MGTPSRCIALNEGGKHHRMRCATWGGFSLKTRARGRPGGQERRNTGCRKARETSLAELASEFLEVFGNVGERKHAQRTARVGWRQHRKDPRGWSRGSYSLPRLREPRAQHRSETILTCVQLVDCALQLFELSAQPRRACLPRQALVVSKVLAASAMSALRSAAGWVTRRMPVASHRLCGDCRGAHR